MQSQTKASLVYLLLLATSSHTLPGPGGKTLLQPHGKPDQGPEIKIAVSFNLEQSPNLF